MVRGQHEVQEVRARIAHRTGARPRGEVAPEMECTLRRFQIPACDRPHKTLSVVKPAAAAFPTRNRRTVPGLASEKSRGDASFEQPLSRVLKHPRNGPWFRSRDCQLRNSRPRLLTGLNFLLRLLLTLRTRN